MILATVCRHLQTLVKCITLRRTKNSEVNGRPLVSLPEKKVYVEQVELSQPEREEYELARTEGKNTIGRYVWSVSVYLCKHAWEWRVFLLRQKVPVWDYLTGHATVDSSIHVKCYNKIRFYVHFCRYVAEGTVLRNYADVLAILMRLRQHCCHPDLLAKMSSDLGKIWNLWINEIKTFENTRWSTLSMRKLISGDFVVFCLIIRMFFTLFCCYLEL